jgi:hypothetical protein
MTNSDNLNDIPASEKWDLVVGNAVRRHPPLDALHPAAFAHPQVRMPNRDNFVVQYPDRM